MARLLDPMLISEGDKLTEIDDGAQDVHERCHLPSQQSKLV
jgi:hypothetical protein